MAVSRVEGSHPLTCPLCGRDVGTRGCANCHLTFADIEHYHEKSGHWSEPWGRGIWSRFVGLVVYAALVAWSRWFMPSVFLFVLPGAIVGAYMQTVRARPVLGAVLFLVIVIVIPVVLWPAGLTGDFSELSRRL